MRIVTPPKETRENLLLNLRQLNDGQREVVMPTFKSLKDEGSKPLRLFLSGAAGVEKSLLIKVIFS